MAIYTYSPEIVRPLAGVQGIAGPLERFGANDTLLSGWVPHEDRTSDQQTYHEQVLATSPKFGFAQDLRDPQPGDKTRLWDVVKAVLGKPFPAYYQITGSCFPPGTPILMADGTEKAIEDVQVGDEVVSHTGTARKVVETFHRRYTGEMHTFHVSGWDRTVTVTDDHDMLVVVPDGDAVGDVRPARYEKRKARDVAAGRCALLPFSHVTRSKAFDSFQTPHGLAAPYTRIEKEAVVDAPVYCVEVEVDHSLVANGIALGQCVGNGGGKAIRYCALVDIYVRGDTERYTHEFYPYTYGRSRIRGGLRGRGEGSFGSSFAEAAREDGTLWWDMEGLPRPGNPEKDWSYGRSNELTWSDGGSKPCTDWLDRGRAYKLLTAPVSSADEVREAIRSYQPVTIASSWGGLMRCQVTGDPPVLLNRRTTTWMHQMMISGWWWHPTLGEIFYIENSWSDQAHGICPTGAPPGGFWVKKADVEYIVRQRDSFRFSGIAGRDPGHVDWSWLRRTA